MMINADKALQRVRDAECLGSLIDGVNRVLRTKSKRSQTLAGPKKALQVYAGKAVVMEVIFEVARGAEEVVLSEALQSLGRGHEACRF